MLRCFFFRYAAFSDMPFFLRWRFHFTMRHATPFSFASCFFSFFFCRRLFLRRHYAIFAAITLYDDMFMLHMLLLLSYGHAKMPVLFDASLMFSLLMPL